MISKYRSFFESSKRITLKDVLKVNDSIKYKDDVLHLLSELGDSSYDRYDICIEYASLLEDGSWDVLGKDCIDEEEYDDWDDLINAEKIDNIVECITIFPKEEDSMNDGLGRRGLPHVPKIKSNNDLEEGIERIELEMDHRRQLFDHSIKILSTQKILVQTLKRIKILDSNLVIYQYHPLEDKYTIIFA